MLKFYYSGAPNPVKVALFLEEAGIPFGRPGETRKGDQNKPDYLKINPNAKVPSIVDGDVTVFAAMPSCSISPKRAESFLPPKIQQGSR